MSILNSYLNLSNTIIFNFIHITDEVSIWKRRIVGIFPKLLRISFYLNTTIPISHP
jgi:hypothetical protein